MVGSYTDAPNRVRACYPSATGSTLHGLPLVPIVGRASSRRGRTTGAGASRRPVELSTGVLDANHPMLFAGKPNGVWAAFEGRDVHTEAGWSPFRTYVMRIDRPGMRVVAVTESSADRGVSVCGDARCPESVHRCIFWPATRHCCARGSSNEDGCRRSARVRSLSTRVRAVYRKNGASASLLGLHATERKAAGGDAHRRPRRCLYVFTAPRNRRMRSSSVTLIAKTRAP